MAVAAQASGPDSPLPQPALPPAYSAQPPSPQGWSGTYLGLQLGYACCGRDRVQLAPAPPGVIGTMREHGGLLTFHGGHNWQRDGWVSGVEGMLTLGNVGDRLTAGTASASVRINPAVELRGRIGRASGEGLFYATGGLAIGRVAYQAGDTAVPSNITATYWEPGLSVGAGYERRLAGGDWTIRGEYSYTLFRGRNLTDGVRTTRATPDYHALRLGLSRRF